MLALLRRLTQSSRVRAAAVGAGALLSLYILLASVHGHYPLQHWLLWRYLQAWLFALVFTVSCLSAGLLTLRLTRTRLPLLERLLFSMAIGVLIFTGVTFVGGLLGLLSPAFAVATPIVVGAPGALNCGCAVSGVDSAKPVATLKRRVLRRKGMAAGVRGIGV